MDTKKLRLKILDLAIRGKLVPQDPNDEPASVLVEKIRAEKERLIKEKKIKRGKNESYIYRSDKSYYEKFADGAVKCIDDEIPFDIPESWMWCRLGSISKAVIYGVSESAQESGDYKLLRITDIQNNQVNWDGVPFTSIPNERATEYLLEPNDILFARTGATVGKSYLVKDVPSNTIYASYLIRVRPFEILLAGYIKYYFESGFYWAQITDKSVGIGQPNVNGSSLKGLLIPLPSCNEQERIIDRATYLINLIEGIENNQKELSMFIDNAKSKILDLAIRGKLVPQDPNDEPASVLLERIKAKHPANKTKSPKTRDNSHYENLPFEIPGNWCWLYGNECLRHMVSVKPSGATFLYIDIDSVDNTKSIVTVPKVILTKDAPSRASRGLEEGDTIFSMVRPYLRNIAFIDKNLSSCIASTGFFVCKPTGVLYPRYLYHMMRSAYVVNGLNQFMKGDNSPSINNDNIFLWRYPVPPYNEQVRIVRAIQNLFALLDTI